MLYRPEEIPLFGSGTLSWESLTEMFRDGRWYSATPSAVREMALQLALNYTRENIDTYRNRDPEHLAPSDTYLQIMWLASHSHLDVKYGVLPTRSKLLPPSLTVAFTQLFYLARRRKGPHVRKTDKGMGLALQSKQWLKTERAKVINDTSKYIPIANPNQYTQLNASRIYLMQKIHKGKIPVPGRILVQGFSYLEASAKFISFFGYTVLKELTTPIKFHEIRAEYEYKGLDMALNQIQEYNEVSGQPTLIELDVEGCYPSIKHEMVNQAFLFFFEYVPAHLMKVYINVWARSLYLLNHTYIQVEGQVYQQVSGLSQGSAAAPFLADFTLFMLDLQYRSAFPYIWHGRFLDDILLIIPAGEDPQVHLLALQHLYSSNKQLITVQHSGTDGFAAWLGFEIHPSGDFRVFVKPTWVNLFSPLYDAISPRLHIGYLIIMAIRFIIFTSSLLRSNLETIL